MEPTLKDGSIVILRKVRKIKPGSIIMFCHDGKEKIKRVSQVNDEGIGVIGDNSRFSTDSRDFGLISHESVLGTMVLPRIS